MQQPKKIKTCKQCKEPITVTQKGLKGMSKFCSYYCALIYKPLKSSKNTLSEVINDDLRHEKMFTHTNLPKSIVKRIKITKQPEKNDKKQPLRSQEYMKYIRTYPCVVCKTKTGIHAHHVESAGLGLKGSDFFTIPLCSKHHVDSSDSIHKLGSIDLFQQTHSLNIYKLISNFLLDYFIKRE